MPDAAEWKRVYLDAAKRGDKKPRWLSALAVAIADLVLEEWRTAVRCPLDAWVPDELREAAGSKRTSMQWESLRKRCRTRMHLQGGDHDEEVTLVAALLAAARLGGLELPRWKRVSFSRKLSTLATDLLKGDWL